MKKYFKITSLLIILSLLLVSLPNTNVYAAKKSKGTGSIKGNVTWQYNEYVGTKPDTGAYVALIPKDHSKLEGKKHKNFSMLVQTGNKDGIYSTRVDGKGEYVIDDVPVGDYMALIVSCKTTDSLGFEDKDTLDAQIEDLFGDFLSEKELDNIKLFIGYNSFTFKNITIKKNKTKTYSYDFGYTYM